MLSVVHNYLLPYLANLILTLVFPCSFSFSAFKILLRNYSRQILTPHVMFYFLAEIFTDIYPEPDNQTLQEFLHIPGFEVLLLIPVVFSPVVFPLYLS